MDPNISPKLGCFFGVALVIITGFFVGRIMWFNDFGIITVGEIVVLILFKWLLANESFSSIEANDGRSLGLSFKHSIIKFCVSSATYSSIGSLTPSLIESLISIAATFR